MHTINKEGLEEIRQQLISKLKSNNYDYQSDEMVGSKEQDNYLSAFASDIEEAMSNWTDNGEVELSPHDTKSGHVEHLSVSDNGFAIDRADLDSFHSIEEIVEELADEDSYFTAHIAGTYGLESAEDSGFGVDADNIEAHLEVLKSQGGVFDITKALYFAEQIVQGEQE